MTNDKIDDKVAQWHEGDSELELYEFIGFTKEQYEIWVQHPNIIGE